MIHAGKLRHIVAFEDFVSVLDSDSGVETGTWAPVFGGVRQRVSIEDLSGRELIAAASVNSKVSARIRMRYRDGITPRMRIVHLDTIYNIEAAIRDPGARNRWLTLLCSVGVNEG